MPYWWDGNKASLAAAIHKIRPDLNLEDPLNALPIPSISPEGTSERNLRFNLNSGGSTGTLPVAQAFNWDGKQDLTGW